MASSTGRTRSLFRGRRRAPRWQFNVDIVGGCNLRCPSCPVGNSPEIARPRGYMKPELLDQIVAKAKRETAGRVDFALYNWTEPFLHPKLAEMIEVVNSYGLRCGLSSNFNIIKNIDAVMEANPSYLKMSVSGFTQETYGITHREGDIELVKENMRIVAAAKARARATTRLAIPFHRYLGNHEDEHRMRSYAESLGFDFDPAWAYMMPVEKVLAYTDPASTDTKLSDADRDLIDRLALPLAEAIEVSKKVDQERCKLRDQQMAITSEGKLMLCCAVYDGSTYGLGTFLDLPLDEIQRRKYAHSGCSSCMRNGLHVLFTYGAEEYDQLAMDNVARHHPEAGITAMRALRHHHPRGIRDWPRRVRKRYAKLAARRRRSSRTREVSGPSETLR